MRDLVGGQPHFLKVTGQSLPDRFPLFSFAQIKLGHCFLRFLQPNRISVAIVVLDDLFLVTAALGEAWAVFFPGCLVAQIQWSPGLSEAQTIIYSVSIRIWEGGPLSDHVLSYPP